jgi:hypothetical protein
VESKQSDGLEMEYGLLSTWAFGRGCGGRRQIWEIRGESDGLAMTEDV